MTCQCGEIQQVEHHNHRGVLLLFICACGKCAGNLRTDDLYGAEAHVMAAKYRNLEESFRRVHDEHPEWTAQ